MVAKLSAYVDCTPGCSGVSDLEVGTAPSATARELNVMVFLQLRYLLSLDMLPQSVLRQQRFVHCIHAQWCGPHVISASYNLLACSVCMAWKSVRSLPCTTFSNACWQNMVVEAVKQHMKRPNLLTLSPEHQVTKSIPQATWPSISLTACKGPQVRTASTYSMSHIHSALTSSFMFHHRTYEQMTLMLNLLRSGNIQVSLTRHSVMAACGPKLHTKMSQHVLAEQQLHH